MSLWEKGLFPLIMLLTLAIADAPTLAQWIQHRSIEDIPAVSSANHSSITQTFHI